MGDEERDDLEQEEETGDGVTPEPEEAQAEQPSGDGVTPEPLNQ